MSHWLSNHCICKVWWAMRDHTILYVTLGDPWAINPLYLYGLVSHASPNHCIRIVWWAMDHQTIVLVWFGELCLQNHLYTLRLVSHVLSNPGNCKVWWAGAQVFNVFLVLMVFNVFHVSHVFHVFQAGARAGAVSLKVSPCRCHFLDLPPPLKFMPVRRRARSP